MNRLFLFFALALVAILTQKIFGADQNENEAQIRNVVQTQQQEAWNRHDAKAYSALFTQDADLINVVGWWWKGRPQIEQKLTDAYTFVFRESTLNINEVEVKFLTPDILWRMFDGLWEEPELQKAYLNLGKAFKRWSCRRMQVNG